MYKSIEDIRKDYNAGLYRDNTILPGKLREDFVFDEDLSVKENRRLVAEHNETVARMTREKMMKNTELDRKLHADVVAYIVDVYNMTEAQANIVENYVYTEKHSFMGDYFSAIDDVAEMVERVLAKK